MGPSSFRSLVLQASFPWLALRAQPHRSLRVSSTNFVPPPSPIRMQLPANIGFRHWQLAHPLHTPYGASLSFVRFTHLRLLPHSPSRASQRLASLWSSRGPPQHCTCLLGVGFPLPGPQVWICTSCLLNMPDTHRVGTPIAGGSSHRTVLVLFTYGSSGPWVMTPTVGRFPTSTIRRPVHVEPLLGPPCALDVARSAVSATSAPDLPTRNS